MFHKNAWFREPLLHFCLLGGLFFALAGGLAGADSEIVVNGTLKAALGADYERKHGLPPTDAQMRGLVSQWIDDEMLYREALRLGLDQSDPITRRRLIQAMKFLAEDEAGTRAATREQLQAVLDKNPESFAIQPTVSFEHIYFPKGKGDAATMVSALDSLKVGQDFRGGHAFIHGQTFEGLSHTRVTTLLGQAFADAVFKLEVDTWVGPVQSSFGQHLVKVSSVTERKAPALDDVANQVLGLWRQEARDAALAGRLKELRDTYEVVDESLVP